ncbi:MAG: glycosyltransferase [Hyphomonas sp.]
MTVAAAIQYGKALARGLILPRPGPAPRPAASGEPLVVAGMFRTGSGLGRAAQRCFEALQQEGAAPVAVDLSELFHQADLAPSVPLQPFPQTKRGTLILFANPPEVERALMGLGLRRWHDWHIIGAWVWELTVAPAEWQRQANMVSEIWAPSRFVADAFEARYDRPVRIVPHHVPVPADPPPRHNAKLQVLTIADARSSLERKNPVVAVEMFRAAFPADYPAELTVKCRNLALFPEHAARLHKAIGGDTRIRLADTTLTDAEQAALLDSADILLSPHRSEGFGMNLAEAMAAGKCVIATGWSGNLAFMDETAAIPLPYSLVPVNDPASIYTPEPGTLWAEPDFAAGVAALQALAADPERRRTLGAKARQLVSEQLGTGIFREALEGRPLPA